TNSSCISATCAAGPPKAIAPRRANANAISERTGRRAGEESVRDIREGATSADLGLCPLSSTPLGSSCSVAAAVSADQGQQLARLRRLLKPRHAQSTADLRHLV